MNHGFLRSSLCSSYSLQIVLTALVLLTCDIPGTRLGNNVLIHIEQQLFHKEIADINGPIHDRGKQSKYNTQFSFETDNRPMGNMKNFVKTGTNHPPFPDSSGNVKLGYKILWILRKWLECLSEKNSNIIAVSGIG